jgi:hypothetical protein
MRRRQLRADLLAACENVNRLSRAISDAWEQRDAARHDLAIAEDALEAERQWRLTSLPALLDSETRAIKAEAEVARIKRVGWAGPGYGLVRISTEDRPWAAPSNHNPDLWPAVHTTWAEMAITHNEGTDRP